jgi:hypothetical protein
MPIRTVRSGQSASLRCAARTYTQLTYTQLQLRKNRRKLRRLSNEVNSVLAELRKGCRLNLSYGYGRPAWQLTSGQSVSAKAAAIITVTDGIVGGGDSLFTDLPGQTWSLQ